MDHAGQQHLLRRLATNEKVEALVQRVVVCLGHGDEPLPSQGQGQAKPKKKKKKKKERGKGKKKKKEKKKKLEKSLETGEVRFLFFTFIVLIS